MEFTCPPFELLLLMKAQVRLESTEMHMPSYLTQQSLSVSVPINSQQNVNLCLAALSLVNSRDINEHLNSLKSEETMKGPNHICMTEQNTYLNFETIIEFDIICIPTWH